MGTIKELFNKLKEKMKKGPQGRQSKAFVRIVQFFALMVVLTIFAKGASSATLPKVEVDSLTTQSISTGEEFSGTVMASSKENVKIPEGLAIKKLHVSPGATVKKGDKLISFDEDEINLQLVELRITLQDTKIALADLQKPFKQDDEELKGARKSAKEARTSYDRTVNTANNTVNEAKAIRDTAYKAYKKAKKNANTKAEALKSLKATYNEANAVWADAKAQAATDKADAQEALNDANEALAKAQESYNSETAGFNLEAEKRQLEISKAQYEVAQQQEKIDKLETLRKKGGAITTPVKGTIAEITPEAGGVSGESDYVSVSTGKEGYVVEFSGEQSQVKQLKNGSTVTVEQEDGYGGGEAHIISKTMPDESSAITVRAKLSGDDWSEGDTVKVSAVFTDKQYWNCVPIAAVRPDTDGYYVFVLNEEESIMGTQTVARKVAVTVSDKDNQYAAIDGVYENNARIIVSSSKPVKDGDKVRVDEAEE